jgi:acyl-CoA carboxylase epsilon subunit-like protein
MSDEPLFRIVRGTPTPEELAAIVGVLWARRQAAAADPVRPVSRWRASAAPRAGRLPHPAPGAWSAAR